MRDQLLEIQIRSMLLSASRALDYHYSNYLTAHKKIKVVDVKAGEKIDVHEEVESLQVIKLELIAYLNWLGRIYHFVENMKRKGYASLSFGNEFKVLRDKWASHRSADDPRGEIEFLHYQVLLNLETSQTFNSQGQYEPTLYSEDGSSVRFNLLEQHSYIKEELEEIFKVLGSTGNAVKSS